MHGSIPVVYRHKTSVNLSQLYGEGKIRMAILTKAKWYFSMGAVLRL